MCSNAEHEHYLAEEWRGEDILNEMRRKDREMSKDFAYSIIDKSHFGTVATINEDGSPYCVPVSPARTGDKIYIHGACQGTKLDNIMHRPKVCISFVGEVKVPPPFTREEFEKSLDDPSTFGKKVSEKFTTEFESAVVFGTASIVQDREEKILGLRLITEKYTPGNMPYFDAAAEISLERTCLIRIDITDIKGKRKKFDSDGVEMKYMRME